MTNEIVVLGGARTAIGTFGGSLAGMPPVKLASTVAEAAMERSGVEPKQVGHVAYGHVHQHGASGHVSVQSGRH